MHSEHHVVMAVYGGPLTVSVANVLQAFKPSCAALQTCNQQNMLYSSSSSSNIGRLVDLDSKHLA